MNEAEFAARADATLQQVRQSLEGLDIDIDVEPKGDGVLDVEFDDGSKMVINRHSAAGEIWVAARSGGFHFRWDGNAWRDTRDGSELFAALSRLVSQQAGAPVVLGRPSPS